jgi:hypothetical protein
MNSSEFQQDYERWRREPFPQSSQFDELDALHAELAYADAMIADSAIPFVAEGRYSRLPGQVMSELDHLVLTAGRLERSGVAEVAQLAAAYKKYAELLKAVCKGIEDTHWAPDP